MIRLHIWPGIEIVCEEVGPLPGGPPESAAWMLAEPYWRATVYNTDPKGELQSATGAMAMTTVSAIQALAEFLAWRRPASHHHRSGG